MPRYNIKREMPTTVDPIYNMPASDNKQVINCAVCGNVEVPISYIVYKYNGKTFCSHNHKHKYIREHPEEEELSPTELKLKGEQERIKKHNTQKRIKRMKGNY